MPLQKIAILHLPVKFLNSLTRLKNEHPKLNLEYFSVNWSLNMFLSFKKINLLPVCYNVASQICVLL